MTKNVLDKIKRTNFFKKYVENIFNFLICIQIKSKRTKIFEVDFKIE